jgi:hypothetical protein
MNEKLYLYEFNTSFSTPLLSPLPSGFGRWNQVSGVVQQSEEEARIHTFLSRSALLLLLRSFFMLSRSFLLSALERGRFPLVVCPCL